jgi:hypothetical protein
MPASRYRRQTMGYSIEELNYIAKVEELLVERARMHDDFNEVDFFVRCHGLL